MIEQNHIRIFFIPPFTYLSHQKDKIIRIQNEEYSQLFYYRPYRSWQVYPGGQID